MEGDGVQLMSKAEIDTKAPFRSVKEAVMMFGERDVLGSEVYGCKLKEYLCGYIENSTSIIKTDANGTMIMEFADETVTTEELDETKKSLRRAREESIQLATSLFSLQHELEQTKMELQQLKTRQSNHHRQPHLDLRDIEDIKYVEDSAGLTEQVVKTETTTTHKVEFEKKKYVTFADPPCVAQVVLPNPPAEAVLQRHPSLRTKKKIKQFIPLIKGIFSKKKGSSEVALA